VVAELLTRGYKVNAPVRNSSKDAKKAAHLLQLPNASSNLRIFDGGDLSQLGSFDSAVEESNAVIHTAAEVVLGESASIITASVDGVNNVLQSVDKFPNVTRFVQTSSVAAIQRYDVPPGHVFTEQDWNTWSSVERGDAYGVAKTEAERIVHKHFEGDDKRSSVAVNPGVVIGPVMTKAHTKASAVFLRDAIYGNKVMNFPATFVDVRDVASAHVNALEQLPAFKGRRFILTNDTPCFPRGALELGPIAERQFPGFKFEPQPRYPEGIMAVLRPLSRLPLVGGMIMNEVQREAQATPVHFSNKAARQDLGVDFRPLDVTVKEGIDSIVDLGFAKLKSRL
jgi:nucleoside-diphosphate-sugar epimerase